MAILIVRSVTKSFGNTVVLRGVSLGADDGEILSLLGPSGCGKTTLLRIIAGLEQADAGGVWLDGRPLAGVPAHQRGFGLMFQDYALFPHKDPAANVAFGLRMQGLPRSQVQAQVAEMLELVGLAGHGKRRVYELSGGEQQRVALARSLAPRPRLLMLDEPLGSLDRALREELQNELRGILRRVGVTAIYVTHDQEEAFAVADRVLIMRDGRIVQQGGPQEVYRRPASPWVARFLGLTNQLRGLVREVEPLQVETAIGCLRLQESGEAVAGQEVTVLVRPEAARLAADCPGEADVPLQAVVLACSFRGGRYRLVVRHSSGQELAFEIPSEAGRLPEPGDPVALALRPEAMGLLPSEEPIG